ncbi:hypothetical protein [Salinarimonas soli]|uniref:Uncharacterized protein n=1 Tax=Salinarimonas soli TaxID=1638099 RepID=A0A5B2V8P4_9HYPH|nr:hypothetical protein [Salinarimonas soli]KAA2234699.1 hypothetical protein F0L46_23330 [Salinarimonas soli]
MDATIGEREKLLAEAVQHVAAELRLVDVSILARYIAQEKHGNIDDLVASSAELFFKPGTLRYGLRAEIDLRWGGSPAVAFDLEFCHEDVTVFFCLTLAALKASVAIHAVTIASPAASPPENTERLRHALQDARLLKHRAGGADVG